MNALQLFNNLNLIKSYCKAKKYKLKDHAMASTVTRIISTLP